MAVLLLYCYNTDDPDVMFSFRQMQRGGDHAKFCSCSLKLSWIDFQFSVLFIFWCWSKLLPSSHHFSNTLNTALSDWPLYILFAVEEGGDDDNSEDDHDDDEVDDHDDDDDDDDDEDDHDDDDEDDDEEDEEDEV